MTSLVGHGAAQEAFETAVQSGSLHHAWLFVGQEGIGKASIAKQLGASIIGGGHQRDALIASHAHPDFKVVEREPWDKSNPPRIVPYDQRKDDDAPARSIRIAQIRMLQPMLNVSPSLGSRRAIVIDAADGLERNAANALLKSLEEPPAGTIFLLVSHAPGRLLPTIRSRCRLLRFEPLADPDMAMALRQALPGASDDEIAALVRAGDGSPGRALRYAGLDLGGIDAALRGVMARGDADNRQRLRLSRELSLKAAQPRYEAFLDRAPTLIAEGARARNGADLLRALDAYAEARELARAARANSLIPADTVFEMTGLIARLAARG